MKIILKVPPFPLSTNYRIQLPYQIDIDDRIKHGMVHTVVHVQVLVIVFPPSLDRQEPCVHALLIPTIFGTSKPSS